MRTREIARALAALLALACAGCGRGERRWNVVLLTLDTTRADALSCYGAPPGATPALDALAAAGTRFDLALASAALTPVSHASILTGLENQHHGLRVMSAGSGFRLPRSVPTLASVLRAAGYATIAVQSAFPVSSWFGFERDFERFESFDTRVDPRSAQRSVNVLEFQRRADETTALVLERLHESARPFFLWVHYWDPHDALKVPPADFLPADVPRDAQGHPLESRALYAAEVHFVDHEIGRLVAALKQGGEFDHTLFVVVADHGEGLGEHGWQHHRLLYQEDIRVPLIVLLPGRAPTAPVPALVRTTDILPTVLEALGIAAPAQIDGRSLLPLLAGAPDEPRTACADAINGYDRNAALVRQRPLDDFVYAIVSDSWKLLYRPAHREASELFDLRSDPRELHDRFAAEPERVRELLLRLAHADPFVTRPFPELQTEAAGVRDVLQGLGYAGEGTRPVAAELWRWSCPAHPETSFESNRSCPQCGSRLVPFVESR
jgi:arylsulfatase A-like enzyme